MEWWQWLVLAVPATVLVVSVTMIIRILSGTHQAAKRPVESASNEAPEPVDTKDPDDPQITWTRPDPLTVQSAGFSDPDSDSDAEDSQESKVVAQSGSNNPRNDEQPAPARGKGEPIDPGDAKPRRVAM